MSVGESDPAAFDPFAGPVIVATAPTTEPQRELWSATRLGREASLAFNESITLTLRGEVDLAALASALDELGARHESLRTTFAADGATQMVAPPQPLAPKPKDWSARADRDEAFRALLVHEVETPFDLEKGPLVRAHLVRLSSTEVRAVLTAHHLVCDGWSTGVLVKEWAALYTAHRTGRPAALPPAESFVAYAREQVASGIAHRREDLRYWTSRFAGQLPVLELPTDRRRPPFKTFAAGRLDRRLPGELIGKLKRAGAQERASLFVSLLAGWSALLGRLATQEELVVGIPSAGQSSGGHTALVGHAVNTLALRLNTGGSRPFRAHLADVRTALLDADEHQSLTFGRLLQALPVARDPSRLPLASVCFNLDRGLGPDELPFHGCAASVASNPRHFENFDLFTNAVEFDGGVDLEVQFNTDLFDEATIDRWVQAYTQVLAAAAADMGTPVDRLPLLTPSEQAKLQSWNAATETPIPDPAIVHRMVEAQAARSPDAVAVVAGTQRLSYGALNARANQVARALQARGVGRGALVGLCMGRSEQMIIGLLGVLKSGAAYVPLDPDYPLERLAFMVEDAQLAALVTEDRLSSELPLRAPEVLRLDRDAALLDALESGDLPPDARTAQSEDPAYVIYTSGSTGKPKGVLVPHRAVANLLGSVRNRPGITADDVVLALTTLSFDIAVSEVILPLTVGARIVVSTRDVASDGARLLAMLHEHRVTFIDATPATYRLLLAAGWSGGEGWKAICTGEALPRDLAEALVDRCGSVWNGYGPTETTVWSTFAEVRMPVERVTIGRPVANTACHILDAQLQPVPLGVTGELFIGGAGVTLGYLRRPELTAERFLADPFSRTPGAKLYKTGDLARYLPDGTLECLGRNDGQVKLRGYRIELGEIDDVLAHHPGIQGAAVIVREDRPGDRRLVGYVQHKAGAAPTDAELRAHLKTRLPDYMVPAHLVHLAQLPLTPNGKIDRRALPAPSGEAPSSGAEFVAPRSEAEKQLAAIWCEVLGVGRVSIHDDFFQLGGHSLLASQVLARLRRDLGVELSFRKMFEAPTVAKFAVLLEGPKPAASSAPTGVSRRTSDAPVPLSLMQRRLWLLEEMDPTQKQVHHLPAAWRFRGPVEHALLELALNTIVARHETLRTTVADTPGGPMQQIAPALQLGLERVDLRDLPKEAREPELHRQMDGATRVPFDLTQLPLFRATLYTLADDDWVLYTLRHNLIWDGWSFDIFLTELASVYSALAKGETPLLPELPVTYRDFTHWHHSWLPGPEHSRQVEFWRQQLEGDPEGLNLPTDRPRPNAASHVGENVETALSTAEHAALTALARAEGATLFTVTFAAFATLLHRYTGQLDLLVGTPVRARTQPETEGMIGPFVNAVVLRARLTPGLTFRQLLRQVRETTLDAFSNQEMPLESLGQRPPMVRAFFSLQDARQRPPRLGPATIEQVHVSQPSASNDMMLWLMERSAGLLAVLNYPTELFDAATAERFLGRFRLLLGEVVQHPDAPVESLGIAEASELHAVKAAVATQPAGRLSERIVDALTADGDAIHIGGTATSKADLLTQARAVAAALAARGVAPGKSVAVLVADPAERLAAWLGTLLAGATLIALDPSQSAERQAAAAEGSILVSRESPAWAKARIDLGEALKQSAGPLPEAPSNTLAWRAPEGTLTYGALAAMAGAAAERLALPPRTVFATTVPAAHPDALIEYLAPLLGGATLAPLETSASGVVLGEALRSTQATALAAPTGTWRPLLETGWKPGAPFLALVVGAAPEESLVAALQHAGARVTATASVPEVPGWFAMADGSLRFLPLGGLGVEVLQGGTATPFDVPGTLTVAGALTKERARFRSDGRLERMGRSDGRVRLGRAVVDPSRIAAVLAEHPSVARAVTQLGGRGATERKLVSWVGVRAGDDFSESNLRAHLRRTVHLEGVTHAFIEVETWPTRADGSLDEGRLPPPPGEEAGPHYEAPRSEAERALAAIFEQLLAITRVGRRDNFFDLGGHSLLAFQAVAAIEQRFGQRISARVLLLNSLEQAAATLKAPPSETTTPAASEPGREGLTSKLLGGLKKRLSRS